MIMHVLVVVDEATHNIMAIKAVEHKKTERKNVDADTVVRLLEGHWFKAFPKCQRIRCDAEGAFVSTRLADWWESQGIELLPIPGEDHAQLGQVERMIKVLRRGITKNLSETPNETTDKAADAVVAAHNELDRVRGFSPNQWVFGKSPGIGDELAEGIDNLAANSREAPRQEFHDVAFRRLSAEKAYREAQAEEKWRRAFALDTDA